MHGLAASRIVQHYIYREAVYIFFVKLSVYLKALERDAGEQWAMLFLGYLGYEPETRAARRPRELEGVGVRDGVGSRPAAARRRPSTRGRAVLVPSS
jgi:hypothetical protein